MLLERHPQSDCQHRRAGERIPQHHRRQQVLRLSQQARHRPAGPRLPLRQLPHLPFAEREKGRLREREEETRSGKYQDHHHSNQRRCRHSLTMGENRSDGKDKGLSWIKPGLLLAGQEPIRL
jgi:hypothetical protein